MARVHHGGVVQGLVGLRVMLAVVDGGGGVLLGRWLVTEWPPTTCSSCLYTWPCRQEDKAQHRPGLWVHLHLWQKNLLILF
jgi:hypothetical protein